ncbi:hypothetical protein [Microbacterium sp. Marseille-Q6965]|uniref:hypothetical protein n=1 Tax=Microbacterium sp. Marseille-Q6965 TaxID=2965072 RepID=UPI0021B7CE97|nr:hypothetical protein [Microbacterium sp. Marseille-Q6965]
MTFAPDTVDPAVPQPPVRDGELFRYVSQPSVQRRTMRKSLTTLLVAAVLTAVMLVLMVAIPEGWWAFLIIAVIGALGVVIWGVMYLGARTAANATGDDLIDLIVVPTGFVTQGGLYTAWEEVAKVEVAKIARPSAPQGRVSVGQRAGHAIAKRLTDLGGANVTVNIHLRDAKAVMARAVTKAQKLAVMDFAGYIHTGLGLRPWVAVEPLVAHLQQECVRRGTLFEITG